MDLFIHSLVRFVASLQSPALDDKTLTRRLTRAMKYSATTSDLEEAKHHCLVFLATHEGWPTTQGATDINQLFLICLGFVHMVCSHNLRGRKPSSILQHGFIDPRAKRVVPEPTTGTPPQLIRVVRAGEVRQSHASISDPPLLSSLLLNCAVYQHLSCTAGVRSCVACGGVATTYRSDYTHWTVLVCLSCAGVVGWLTQHGLPRAFDDIHVVLEFWHVPP